jgi:hypothetical protein
MWKSIKRNYFPGAFSAFPRNKVYHPIEQVYGYTAYVYATEIFCSKLNYEKNKYFFLKPG